MSSEVLLESRIVISDESHSKAQSASKSSRSEGSANAAREDGDRNDCVATPRSVASGAHV